MTMIMALMIRYPLSASPHPANTAATDATVAPAWFGAIATAVGVAVAIIAIYFTYRQVRLTAVQLRLSSEQAAQDSEDRTRPYITMNVVPGLTGHGAIDLVIENTGQTTARDIRITLVDAEFGPQSNDDDHVGPGLQEFFATPFDLSPRGRMRFLWHLPETTKSNKRGAMGAPQIGEVLASYYWDGAGIQARKYTTRLRYNLVLWPRITPAPSTGSVNNGLSGKPVTHLKNIDHALRSIAHHTGEANR